jgi:hypothetical protein
MLDAIAYCGTPSCISVVKDVTINGEVAGERANMFLQSIALVAKTTNSMIRDILDIAQQKPSRQVFLTLGTMISRHCAKTPADCGVNAASAVVQAENFLEKTLGECEGQDDHERVEQILITLKAIGNAKRPTNARSALIRCAKDSVHTNITMSAFDALRGMPCDENTLGELRQVIANEHIAADKRIYAFQAAMKCPTKANLELIVNQYSMEKNNQLASFMWTYLTNLEESNNPENKEAKTLLATLTKDAPLKKTDLPMYAYSKNFEKSLYLESIKTGVAAKANLVFHPDGFLPKSAVFDVTANIMGVPTDIVETVVGIDGVETVLENAFGPDGVLPKEFDLKMFNWKWSTDKLKEMVEKRVRREVKPSKDAKLNDIHSIIDKKPAAPSGFMTLKIMGQEVRIMSYDDVFSMVEQIDNMNVIQLLLNWAKGGQKTFSKSMMFLDMTHTVPTGLGLPLKLKLSGSTVGTVDLSGKFDIRSLFWGPAGLNVNGFVRPTAVVDISGKMGIESSFASTGLLVSNNMMVQNELKGSIQYKEGEILKINLDTPSEPVQLFHASSTPFLYVNEVRTMIEGVPRKVMEDKCLKSKIIGYGLCGSIRAPIAFRDYEAPYFPLSGPAQVGVSLVRGDDKLTTFQFLTTMTKVANGIEGVVEFSAPGATYERKLNGKMLYTTAGDDKVLTLSAARVGSVRFSHNVVTRTSSVEAKNTIMGKEMIGRVVLFNVAKPTGQNIGIKLVGKYGDMKAEHVTKVVKHQGAYALETMTELNGQKASGALKFSPRENKLTASMIVGKMEQSVEMSGKYDWTPATKGVTLTIVHPPTKKSVSVYAGLVTAEGKTEVVTSATYMGKPIKNILGYYKDGEKYTIRNFFLYNQKSATIDGTFDNTQAGTKEVQLNADIFGQRAMSNVLYNDRGEQKLIRMTADAAGKRLSANMVITNAEVEKSVRLTVDADGKRAEGTMGFYTMRDMTILKVEGDVMGKRAEMFWKLRTSAGYESTFGGVFDKYVGGLRATYSNSNPKVKGLCSIVYYGTTEGEKIAFEACSRYNNLDSNTTMRREVSCSMELPQLKQKIVMLKDFTYTPGRINTIIRTLYNDQNICTKRLNLQFEGIRNSGIELIVNAGKYDARVKAYTMERNAVVTDIGLKMSSMGNSLDLLNRYEDNRGEGQTRSVLTTSIRFNGRELPVSTSFELLNRNKESIVTSSFTVGDYTLKDTQGFLFGNGNRYGWACAMEVLKGRERMGRVFIDYVATATATKYGFDNVFGFAIKEKEYKYGWHVEYENQSVGPKLTHLLRGKIQYSTGKVSSITAMFSNSDKLAQVELDVEYIPTKSVRHLARFDKVRSQLDLSVEFLPKMFANFMARLENRNGYELVTSTNVEWKDYKRVLKLVHSYTNDDKKFMVSTSIAGDITFGLRFDKLAPNTLTLSANVFGNSAEIVAQHANMNIRIDLNVNGKNIGKITGSYDQVAKSVRFYARKGEKIVLDLTTGYDKVLDAFNMAITGAKSWAGVNVNKKGDRTVVSLIFMKKVFAKIIFNSKENSMAIQMKSSVSLLFKYAPESNTMSMTIKTRTNRLTLTTQADWSNKVAAVQLILNKERFGVKVAMTKKSINLKLTATPLVTVKSVITYNNNKLSMVLQRITKDKIINEATFQYELNSKTCDFLFNWNAENWKKIADLVAPLAATASKDAKELLSTAWRNAGNMIKLSKEAQVELLNFLNKMEKAFDDFDFVAARDEVGALTLKAMKKLSAVTVNALNTLAATLDKIKANVPVSVEKVRELIKQVKAMNINLDMKANELVAKVKALVPKAKELVMKAKEMILEGQKLLVTISADLDENLKKIIDVATLVATNFTDASRPVVEKAIVLLKDFKIRGQRLEDLVKMATTEGKKIMDKYAAELNAKVTELKAKATLKVNEIKEKIIASCTKAINDLKKMKVPYTDKTVEQVIEILKTKIAELREKVKTMDAEKLMAEMKTMIMDYQVKGRPISAYITLSKEKLAEMKVLLVNMANKAQRDMKELPEATRKTLKELVAMTRVFIADMEEYFIGMDTYVKTVTEFTAPLVNHAKFVQSSVTKHFGPLAKKLITKLIQLLNTIEVPTVKPIVDAQVKKVADFMLPLAKPMVPLYRNILGQVRGLNVAGFRVGIVMDMQKDIMATQMTKMVAVARDNMNKQMAILNNMVEDMKKTTPEQVIDNSIDSTVRICNELVNYMNSLYEKRAALSEKATTEVTTVYNKMKAQYEQLKNTSIDDVTETIITTSSDSVTVTVEELSNIIKQIVAMDISGPTWQAWTEADLLGHLERYGVNGKISAAIAFAKKTNMTTVLFKTIATIQEFINTSATASSAKVLDLYKKLDVVFKYLKSIPKKDCDKWIAEVTEFTLNNKEAVQKTLVQIYETSRAQAMKAYETLAKMAKGDAVQTYKQCVEFIKQWYDIVAEKSQLVYEDVKQPSIDVYNHYRNTIMGFLEKQFEIIKKFITTEYAKIYADIKAKVEEFRTKVMAKITETIEKLKAKSTQYVEDLKKFVRENYAEFLKKYGNLTWDDVAKKIEGFAVDQVKAIKEKIITQYKKIMNEAIALRTKVEAKVMELYTKAITEYRKAVAQSEKMVKETLTNLRIKVEELRRMIMKKINEIKPKVIETYKKYEQMIQMEADRLMAKVKALTADAKAKVIEIYNLNKDKTLKQIFDEITKIIVSNYLKQKEYIKALSENNFEKAKAILEESKSKAMETYGKVGMKLNSIGMKLNTVIIPELMAETESIINQTLRNSVIMAKEITRAYTPQAIVVMDAAKTAAQIIKVQAPVLIAKAKGMMKMDLTKVQDMLKKTIAQMEIKIKSAIDTLKKNEKYTKYVAILEAKLAQLKGIVTAKVEELKKNPTLLRLKSGIETRIADLKMMIKLKIEEIKKNPTFISSKAKLEEAMKTLNMKIDVYGEKLDIYVKQIIDLLKQIKKSGKFTIDQLKMNLKPRFDATTMKITEGMTKVPEVVSRGAQYFMDAPEDAFWAGIATWKEATIGAYKYAKTVEKQAVIAELKKTMADTAAFSKDLYTKSTDEWTKATIAKSYDEMVKLYNTLKKQYEELVAQGKGLPELIKALYAKNMIIVEAYYEKNMAIVKKQIAALKVWAEKQVDDIKKSYETSALKAIINNELWGEIATEFNNHELVTLAKTIKAAVTAQADELIAKVKKSINELTPVLKEKYAHLMKKVEKETALIKSEVIATYKNVIEQVTLKTTLLMKNAEKIWTETTIAEIVAYVEKAYKLALVKVDELKVKLIAKFNELKTKYMAQAKEMITKYQAIINAKIEELKMKINAKIEELKTKVMPYYTKLVALYKKYYNEIETKLNALKKEVIAKYNTIKKMTTEKYEELVAKVLEQYNKYKTMGMEEIKKVREMIMKKWEELGIMGIINDFRKMTIVQTIDELVKLPTEIMKKLIAARDQIVATLKKVYAESYAKVEKIVKDLLAKAELQLEKIMKMLKPYIDAVKGVYGNIENEIRETVTFVYNYYGLEEKFNTVSEIVIAETQRMIAKVKNCLAIAQDLLNKYAEEYKTELKKSSAEYIAKYKKLVDVYAKQAADEVSKFARDAPKKALCAIHKTMKTVDGIDMGKLQEDLMNFVKKINEFVVINTKPGEFSIKITHPSLQGLKPSVDYYKKLVAITAKRTLKDLNVKVKTMLKNVKTELDTIKEKADKLRMQIQEAIMKSTVEIRRDFNISYKVNKNIANRIYQVVKAVVMRNYALAKVQYDAYMKEAQMMAAQVNGITQYYGAQLKVTGAKIYKAFGGMIEDISRAESPKAMYVKMMKYVNEYYNILKREAETMIATYRPFVAPQLAKMKQQVEAYIKTLEGIYKQLKAGYPYTEVMSKYAAKLKTWSVKSMAKVDKLAGKLTKLAIYTAETYSKLMITAYNQLKAGIPVSEVMQPLVERMTAVLYKLKSLIERSNLREKMCSNNLELCKLVDESIAVHKMLVTKYGERIKDYLSTSKAVVDRAVRKLNKEVKVRNINEKYTATAMLMGDHVLTFDNTLYNIKDFAKSKQGCRYLLARDFQDKKFTIVKSDGAITVETPDMAIKIRDDGRTRTTIGNSVSNSLPVESGAAQCVRMDNLILCHFKDQKMKITVDLKNKFTTISVSGWYKGKTQGLLGTYNNEHHDEWRLPNNIITKNINEFTNAYEVSGNPQCQSDLKMDHNKVCMRPMSAKCKSYFMDNESPYSAFFGSVSPKPFMELCRTDSKCNKRAKSKAHCSVVASYVTMLRTRGIWVSHPAECMGDRGREINEEWTQKPMKKAVDVVVMVSQNKNMMKMKKRIAATMYQLHRALKNDKLQVRFALIGFGGAGINKGAHIHPLRRGQTVFGYILDLNKEIKSIPYEGTEENDAYHAILRASQLKFRPGAEKIFIMFNSEPHTAVSNGPTYDETRYILQKESNAQLIVFDTVNFGNFGKEAGRVIGQTERKLYTAKNTAGLTNHKLDLPSSEFKSLVQITKGALFSNTSIKKPKQAAISLHDAVKTWISKDIQMCKRCTLRNSWTGQSRPICVADPTAQC